jgi:NhaA family Na+:H+ antiporter
MSTDGQRRISARHATPARSLPGIVARFIRTEAASGLVLVIAAVTALVWANSPWSHGYERLWHTQVAFRLGPFRFDEDLTGFVNDGLMTLFFFVVGLEIKREVVRGELADRRIAALPVCAALGGMIAPVCLYLLVVVLAGGGPATSGWGVPMATDIAFALGAVALLGSRVPPALKLFLLTLAVVDDVGAIVVIAVFYGGPIDGIALAAAAAGVLLTLVLRRQRVDWPPIYVALAVATWYATYQSGIHATIAGVALALATPAHPLAPAETVRRWAHDLSDQPSAAEARQLTIIARQSVSPAEHLEELLHPTTSFVVLPLFALANIGVELHAGMLSAAGAETVATGVIVGLVAGKLLGILAGTWIGVRSRLAVLADPLRWRHLVGAAALGGIGFTVSLFVSTIAFDDPRLTDAAKLAVLTGSFIAAGVGVALLAVADRTSVTRRGRGRNGAQT